jgi:SAM-dependent methyltransferase
MVLGYASDMVPERLWNVNIQYHELLLKAVPDGAARVLDVGCGDGVLCAQLVEAGVRHVVGLDADAGVLERARARYAGLSIEWVHGDVFDSSLATAGEFDAVFSVATLHHMDAARALARFAELVRPGGMVAVVGLAATNWWDLPYAAIGHGARIILCHLREHWEHSAPTVWPPPVTYGEMKRIARRVLPGSRYRRLLLGRYSLIWTKARLKNKNSQVIGSLS